MLPPTYRKLWKEDFQKLKDDDLKAGNGWMYEADPFAALREREAVQTLTAKQKSAASEQKSETLHTGHSHKSERGWTHVPKIDLGKRMRSQVEELVRRYAVWNPHGTVLPPDQKQRIMDEFCLLGFRKSHIQEALAECRDRAEALEWLLIYVPEDDLPQWSLPESYFAGFALASGNIKREASMSHLVTAGFNPDLCEMLLSQNEEDEAKVAEILQTSLVRDVVTSPSACDLSTPPESGDLAWNDESETLNAIYGSRYEKLSDSSCRIKLQVLQTKDESWLQIQKSRFYPAEVPIIFLEGNNLPAYIKLSIYRQAIQHASSAFVGQHMIFNLVDWLESEIPRITENPGKLRDIGGATSLAINHSDTGTPLRFHKPKVQVKQSIKWQAESAQGLAILNHWQQRQTNPAQMRMLEARQTLPAWALKDAIIETVNDNQVTILSGATGSGKSSQSVQFVLDDLIQKGLGSAVNIVCTQPRRISALALADRVSEERCSSVGDEVGYSIRGDSKHNVEKTKITFVTTGVLLRRLQTSGGNQETVKASLANISHIFVDEVHERSLDTDFLLTILKSVLATRKDLKVVLMSATLDAGFLESYFKRGTNCSIGKVEIQGRTFPVDDYYLDDIVKMVGFSHSDGHNQPETPTNIASAIQSIGMHINYDLVAATIKAIDGIFHGVDGSLLIFLPGVMEVNRTITALQKIPNVYSLPLHASLLPAEQKRVFNPAPMGKRKVIAATNVAETSITIPDIVGVIDTGKVKETSFDSQTNMVRLLEVWASRAACEQRRGRAGRVRAGKCYKLYTRNAEAKMQDRPEPEIRRVPLEQLCLSVRAMGVLDITSFLASALTPPDASAIEAAIRLLQRTGLFDGNNLTALGLHLSLIPADLRCGKLMVYGTLFGCFEACLTISAVLSVRSPFISYQSKREESKAARLSFSEQQGDLIADLRAYEEWAEKRKSLPPKEIRSWCDQNCLSYQTMVDIMSNRSQFISSLKDAGLVPLAYGVAESETTSLNTNNSNTTLLRALIAGSFSPQIARIRFPDQKYAASSSGAVALDPEARTIKYYTEDAGRAFIHPSSTLFDAQTFPGQCAYMSFFSRMATSKVFIRDLTPLNPHSLLMFCGPITIDTMGRGLVVDGWLRLRGWARIGVLIGRLRVMLDDLLKRKMESPSIDLSKNELIEAVIRLIEFNGLDR